MYTIFLIAALFGNSAPIATDSTFITREACTLVATRLTQASGITHECRAVAQVK